MLTLQFWNSSFVLMYNELVPPGLAIEDVAADHLLAVQLLHDHCEEWLYRTSSIMQAIHRFSPIVTVQDSRETNCRENPLLKSICHFFGSLLW